jgi:eukaryotic-like serine/threonine-protein kinase
VSDSTVTARGDKRLCAGLVRCYGTGAEVNLSTTSAIVPGQILLGKYRVEELLGRGGMGVVFAARHLALDERVAIKVLAPAASEHQDALARLQREARILARVRNEHVVRVIDLGQLDDGAPFMVMEHLTGRDLGSLLEEQGRLGVEAAVSYILQALIALAAAHANGVVHRDLKPENLFCSQAQDGSCLIKVLDFGISRLDRSARGTASASMTGPSAVMGTPLYMSPEQLRDPRAVDARSDIWSIGVVLYELVAGVAPFSGASLGDIAIKIATEPPPPLTFVAASIASQLEDVLSRCLRKERDERFANVAQLARALEPFGPAGCRQLVERVERLAAEPPIYLGDEQSSPLPDSNPLTAPAPPEATLASPPAPPAASAARWRPSGAQLLLALCVPIALVAAWRLTASRAGTPAETAVAAGLIDPAPSPDASRDVPRIASSVSQPEAPLQVNDQPAARTATGDVAKSLRAASSSRSLPAAKDPCVPPYTIDPQGRKKFRHECFTERAIR